MVPVVAVFVVFASTLFSFPAFDAFFSVASWNKRERERVKGGKQSTD